MRSRLWIHPDCPELGEPEFAAAWNQWRGERIDENRLRSVERVVTAAGPAYLKRFHGIQLKNEIKLRVLQRPRCTSQAWRELVVIDRLRRRGFRAPVVIAAGAETSFGHERRSLLMTLPLRGTALCELEPDGALVRDVGAHLGRVVRERVFLPDLGLDHVFVDGTASYGLLDFHNARFTPAPSSRELGRAIVRFFRSPGGDTLLARDLLEPFARAYLRAAGRDGAWPLVQDLCGRRLPV